MYYIKVLKSRYVGFQALPLRGPSTAAVNKAEIYMCSGITCLTGGTLHANLILERKGPDKKIPQKERASPNYQFAVRKFLDRKLPSILTDLHRRPHHLATSFP
jgi:hypothetical protein